MPQRSRAGSPRGVHGYALALALFLATPISLVAASDFSCSWTTGTSGIWSTATNWSTCNGTFPNNSVQTYDATIAAGGTYTVTLNTATTLNNLTINSAGATLSQTANTLTMASGGIITVLSGTYQLNGGKISGGTIQQTGTNGLSFTSNSTNTLNGVEFHGDLNLNNGSSNALQITNGLTLRNEANTGNGTANLANSAEIGFRGTQTFNNATINLAAGTNLTVEQAGSTLTLGSGVLVQGAGGVGATQFVSGGAVSLINQGILRGNVSGQTLTIGANTLTLTNSLGATIEAINGATVTIGATALTNAGTINAGAGSTLNLNATNLTNTGTVNVLTSTSTLNLGGTTTTAGLAGFSNTAGGTFNLTGTLTNTAATLQLGGTLGTMTLAGGTIVGGIVQEATPTLLRFTSASTNTLNGVEFHGDLNLNNGSSNALQITNGLTLRNEANTGNGTANLANSAEIGFRGTQTFNNATINLAAGTNLTVEQAGSTLTLGSGVLVQGAGGVGATQFVSGGAVSLINQGILRGNVSGQTLTIGANTLTLTNSLGATIEAINGATVTIGATALTNAGTINAGAGSTLNLNATNLTNTGTVNVLTSTSTLNLGGTTTTAGLAGFSNTAGGTFNLTGTLTNTAATLQLGGTLGTMTLAGGTIVGGIVQEATPTLLRFTSASTNTLNGVEFHGDLNLNNGSSNALQITNGLTLRNEANTGNGTANLANSAEIGFRGTQTFDNATINLAAGTNLTVEQAGSTLTLGSGVLVQGAGGVGATQFVSGGAVSLINQGILRGNVSGQTLTIGANTLTLTNSLGATIEAINGATVTIGATALTNAGTINAGAGSTLNLNATNLTNTGTVNVLTSTSTLNLGGTTTTAGLAGFSNTAGGTFNLTGTLTNTAATLQLGGTLGTMTLAGGTIVGGIVQEATPTLLRFTSASTNTLNGVEFHGDLDLNNGSSNALQITNGLTLRNEANTGNGTANLANSAEIGFRGTQTFNNATINLAAGTNLTVEQAGSTLTLGSGVLVQGAGGVGATQFVSGGAVSLINQGILRGNVSGQTLTIGANTLTLTNSLGATIEAINGATVTIGATALTNAGTINAGAGSTLNLNATNLTNTGTVNVLTSTSTLNLGGTTTTAGLAGFSNTAGGTFNLTGTLTNTAATLQLGGTLGTMTLAGGTIVGGIVQEATPTLLRFTSASTNTLNGVEFHGDLNLNNGSSNALQITNGLTLRNEANTGNGTANLANSAEIGFRGTQTFNNATINLAAGTNLTVEQAGSTLTLGSGVLVQGAGGVGATQFVSGGAVSLINQGILRGNVSGQTLTIGTNTLTLTNSGTIEARSGATVTVLPNTLTNSSGGTLTGGTWSAIGNGSTLTVRSTAITTNAATIVLDTAGSIWRTQDPTTNVLTTIESSLTNNAGAGTLEILNNRNYTTANALANAGTLQLGGGTLTAASLTNSGQIFGFGTLANNVANSGTVRAAGGLLTASNGITGSTGTVQIDAGASLTLGAASTTGTLTHNGTALNLGANNITVSTAYTNANFGTGNSFNNRANVTGAGQILAAGATPATAQTLSGNLVGGTTTGAAAINFGNVHVGNSVTLNYQIGNSNAGGPSLSGAIQTAVNGGNITDARLSGTGVTSSNWGAVANGATTAPLGVTFNATSSGALTGQVVLVRNNFDNTNSQNVTLLGAAYDFASVANGGITPTPVVLANQRVGGTGSQTLTVTNTAPVSVFSETLTAGFGANSGNVTNNAGSITALAPGSSSTAMSVGVNTSAAGAQSGSVTVNLTSNAVNNSGLGNTVLAPQTITVSGNVYQAAIGQLNSPTSLSFGTVQVGQTVAQTLSISNIATGPSGFVEDLGASFGTTSGVGASLITGTGSIGSLLAGGTDSSSLVVHINTAAAGNVNGAIAINYTTNGTVNSVSNGLGSAAAGSSSFGVVGTIGANVVDTANPVINTSQPINLGNVRIGASSPTALVSVTNQASGNQQAALNASIAGNAPVTASGSFNLLAPGSTNNTSLQVGMNTGSAGHIAGTATVSLVSDASNIGNCAPNCQMSLPSQNVNVTGNVYQVAQPTLPTNVSLGNVHVGGTLSQGLNVTNTLNAPVGFQEGLNATVASTTGAATAVGSITNLAAASSNNSGIVVGINTAVAGAITGTATLGLQSNGTGTSGLSTLDLPNSAPITIAGNVYNLAVGSTTPTPVTIANQRVGGSNSQALTVANSAPAGSFTEVLNASFGTNTGSATNNGGSIAGGLGTGGVVGGGSNNTAMSVGVNTTAAGARSGTVTLNYVSNGTGSSGLGNTAATVPAQTINVSGNVYQAAIGQLNSPTSLSFGTVQVGQTVAQTLSISNIATGPSGFVEDLGASFGTTSGVGASLITGTGSIGSLLAGGTDSSSLVVHINTAAAGNVNGAIAINYTTNGTVNSVSNGLGSAAAGSSSFGVVGTIGANVVDTANPVINTSQPINLGNVRIGASSPTALVSVTNQASGNQQAALNASIAGNAPVTASGSFNLLAPGSTNNTSLQVGMNTGSAGHIAGTATVSLVSDASNIGNCAPNCQMSLPSQNVNVTGNVYQVAQPTLPTNVSLGNVHVGGTLSQGLNVTNTLNAPVGFQEGLNATVASTTGAATAVGSITNLAAASSNNSGIVVGINTAVAGAITGTATLGLQSNGTGTSGLSTLDLPNSAPITIAGNVYNLAVGSTTPTPVTIANQRVGGSNSQALTVANSAPAGSFTEVLNASFGTNTGSATNNGGSIAGGLGTGGVVGGGSNNTAMSVGVNTTAAGARSGTVTLNYVSNGTGSSGLGNTAATVPAQTINVSGNVYQAAIGQLNSPTSLSFGTVQVGQTVAQTLSISNIATGPSGFVEDLGASFGTTSGVGASLITGTGSIGSLLAGGTDSSSLVVHINTAAAGNVNGAIAINYTTNGTVNSVSNGLGSAAAGSSSFGVVGTIGANVVDTANPVINTSQPINLGNVRIGASSPTALVSVTNQASGNQQAALNASIAGNAPVTASGSFNLLAPGSTNNTSLQVGMNTGSAGHIAGTATVSLVSDASNIGNCAPNCQMSLPSQNVNVAMDVYRLASPQLNTSALTLAGRVGGVGDSSHLTGAISIANSSPDTFTEGLTVTRGTLASVPGGGFSGSGGVTNLAAQGSSSAIQVSLNTGTSGSFTGSQALNYVSTGVGTDGAADIGVGSGSVTLNGHVYTPAAAQVNTTQPINLGIVHVGDAAPHANVSVTNTANGALNDALLLGFASASTGLTGSSNVGATGLAGGQTNSAALNVAMNTGSAGTFNGNVNFTAASHDSELTDLALAQVAVAVSGQVNNYATSAFAFGGGAGTFSQSGSIYTLDFGTVFQGSGLLDTTLFAQNSASGPADLLDGSFDFLDGMDFGESGFNPFTNLAAGQQTNALLLALNTANLGMISDDIVLDGTGHNASGYSAAIGDITLIIRANVIERTNGAPEPGTLALLALAVLLLLGTHQRHRRAFHHTH